MSTRFARSCRIGLLVGAVSMLGLNAAHAQGEAVPAGSTSDRLGLRVEGGVALPLTPSEFPEGWSLGFGAAGGLDYDWKPGLQLTTDLSYYRFANELSGQSSGGSNLSGNSIWTLSFLGGVRMQSSDDSDAVAPFIHGSMGLAIASITAIQFSGSSTGSIPSETEVAFTLELNGGATYRPAGSNIGYIFDVGWQPIFVSGEMLSYLPIRFGIVF